MVKFELNFLSFDKFGMEGRLVLEWIEVLKRNRLQTLRKEMAYTVLTHFYV